MRQHGTRACYVFGPDGGQDRSKGCRCAPCSRANRAQENERNRQIAYGRWQPYVDAGPAREHLRLLAAAGIGWKRAAELSGISTGAVSKLLYGGPGSRPPTRRVRPETEAAILAVRPSAGNLAGAAPVDPTGTRRRVQALVARGWSQAKIAARVGMTPANFGAVLHDRAAVSAATARAVAAVYREWQFAPPPERTHRDKIAASRSRRYAAERGWAPPAAWDDIDDPQASPAAGWQRSGGLSRAEVAAEVRDLERLGLSRGEAAARVGVSPQNAGWALRAHPEEGGAA